MSSIVRIEITTHDLALDPPFPAAWDPRPRTTFSATIVRVYDSEGRVGIGSGDAMHCFGEYAPYFLGEDPLDIERHHAVLSNVSFHAGRPWPMEVALWDLAGKTKRLPVWKLLGGTSGRVRGYASTGVLRSVDGAIAAARGAIERGFPAVKLRLGRPSLDEDIAIVHAVRDAIGDGAELMIDCNQGWRMPWDNAQPWDLARAADVTHRLEPARPFWIEEPLHRGDYAGYTELRQHTAIRIAGGEMTREPYEFRELLERECLDVLQPDCVLTLGITGVRDLALDIERAGKIFTPHTWGNGIGLLANLHVAAAVGNAPFVEFPFDPPEWTSARRDFMLEDPIEPDAHGWIALSDAPGLDLELNEAALARTISRSSYFG